MLEKAVVHIGWFTNGIKYTDDFKSYNVWGNAYDHQTVNHSKHQYAIGDIHTNGIEGIFQGLRHWLNMFVGMFEFNFKHRDLNPIKKFYCWYLTLYQQFKLDERPSKLY